MRRWRDIAAGFTAPLAARGSFGRRVVFAGLVLAACGARPSTGGEPTAPRQVVLRQVWASSGTDYDDTDSLAIYRTAEDDVRLVATSKGGHRLDVFDVASGRHLARVGGPERFRRPNGVAALDAGTFAPRPLLLVVERDAGQVQALWGDNYEPAGRFGGDVLQRPYGVACYQHEGTWRAVVTDTKTPADRTVHEFRLELADGAAMGVALGAWGATDGPGHVATAESILVDAARGRTFVCDEAPDRLDVKVYSLAGEYSGKSLAGGLIQGEPEGLAMVELPGLRWLLVTDQRLQETVWQAFDAGTLEPVAEVRTTPTLAHTDGVAVWNAPVGAFSAGVLCAVHDDGEIRAYNLSELAEAALLEDRK